MKTIIPKSLSSLVAIVTLTTLNPNVARAQTRDIHYRFTGTVERPNEGVPFASPLFISDELQAEVGDPITGTIQIPVPNPREGAIGDIWTIEDGVRINIGTTGTYASRAGEMNRMHLEININGHTVSSIGTVTAVVGNDLTRPSDFHLPNISPASDEADMFVLAVEPGDGLLLDGRRLNGTLKNNLGMSVNLIDPSGRVYRNASLPALIALQDFATAKGVIVDYTQSPPGDSTLTQEGGIMFNIDSLERIDSNAPTSVELATGYHVSWPSDAEGYVLEEAESPEGPWVASQVTPIVVDGQNIVMMELQSRSKFYRLVNSN